LDQVFVYKNVFNQPAALTKPYLVLGYAANFNNANSFIGATGTAYDGVTGSLYVGDGYGNRLLRFDNILTTALNFSSATVVFGQTSFTGTAARSGRNGFYNPDNGFVVNGTLYLADSANNRILGFANVANITTNGPNATFVIGQPDFNASTGSLAGLGGPVQIFESSSIIPGSILVVAEYYNNRTSVYYSSSRPPNCPSYSPSNSIPSSNSKSESTSNNGRSHSPIMSSLAASVAASSPVVSLRNVCVKSGVQRTIPINAWQNICKNSLRGTLSITRKKQCCNGVQNTSYVIATTLGCNTILTHKKAGGLVRGLKRPFQLCRTAQGKLSCLNNIWTCSF